MFRHDFGRCPLDHTALAPLAEDPLEGVTLADRYMIERCVGEGGMGRVYRARHRNLDRLFAVKVLYGDLAANSKMRLRFEREARAASRVDHPNLVSVLDSGITDTGLLYLVMTYVEGRELGDIIEDEAPLPAERVTRLVRQLCQGLAHAHGQGLVHRDFKGQNVLVTGTGADEQARILDFGLAFMRLEPSNSRLTTEGVVMGTPAYMSPEQATASDLDHRTDLFSLGVLMYEMLAGRMPFDGSPVEIARQNLASEPPPIARRVPGLIVDPGLEGISHRLMRKLPGERYQSAHEILTALDILAAGDQDTHSVPVLTAVATTHRPGPVSARITARGMDTAAAGLDTTGETQSMGQEPAAAPATAATAAMAPAASAVAEPSATAAAAGTAASAVAEPSATAAAAAASTPALAAAPAVLLPTQESPARAPQNPPARAPQQAPARKPAGIATERVRPGRRSPALFVAVAAGLALVTAGVIALLVRNDSRDDAVAAGTPESAEVVAPALAPAEVAGPAVVVDAGATSATAAAIDAAPGPAIVAAAVPNEREPSRSRDPRRPRRGQDTTGTASRPATGPTTGPATGPVRGPATGPERTPANPPPAGEESAAAADVEALYKRVGAKLAAFESEHGAAAARPLWAVYTEIPLLDAMRTPSVGQDAMRTLRRIERDIASARPATP